MIEDFISEVFKEITGIMNLKYKKIVSMKW